MSDSLDWWWVAGLQIAGLVSAFRGRTTDTAIYLVGVAVVLAIRRHSQ